DEYPGLQPYDTQVVLPRGRIEQVTASASTVKGAPATFAILDQKEEWVLPNHHRLANNMRTNVVKNGGRTLESPNAYDRSEERRVGKEQRCVYEMCYEGKYRVDMQTT